MSCQFCTSFNKKTFTCHQGPAPEPVKPDYTCRSFQLKMDNNTGKSVLDKTDKSYKFWRKTADERLRKLKKIEREHAKMKAELKQLREEVASLSGTLDSAHVRERDILPFVVSAFNLSQFVEKEYWTNHGSVVEMVRAAQHCRPFIDKCLPANRLSDLEELCL